MGFHGRHGRRTAGLGANTIFCFVVLIWMVTAAATHISKRRWKVPWEPTIEKLPKVVGKRRDRILRVLEGLLPNPERSPRNVLPGKEALSLPADGIVPICLATFPSEEDLGLSMHFIPPIVEDILIPHDGENNLRNCSAFTTGSITLTAKTDSDVLVRFFPRGDQLRNLVEFSLNQEQIAAGGIGTISHWKVVKDGFSSKNSWTSGGFIEGFPSSNNTLSIVTEQKYYVQMYWKEDPQRTHCRLRTGGFENVGGENIGSLFLHGGRLYSNARVNVPYNLHSILGHGYRQAGFYEVVFDCPTSKFDCQCCAHGRHKTLYMLEDECLSRCGQYFKYQDKFSSVILNGSLLTKCEMEHKHPSPWERSINKTLFMDCVHKSVIGGQSFVIRLFEDFVRCSTQCRLEHQVYQTGISSFHGRLLGTFAINDEKNSVRLCHGNSHISFRCFSKPIFFAKSKPTHPLVSEIVQTGRFLLAASSCDHGRYCCTIALQIWRKENFCRLSALGTVQEFTTLPLILSTGCVGILWETNAKTSGCSKDSVHANVVAEDKKTEVWNQSRPYKIVDGDTVCTLIIKPKTQRFLLSILVKEASLIGLYSVNC